MALSASRAARAVGALPADAGGDGCSVGVMTTVEVMVGVGEREGDGVGLGVSVAVALGVTVGCKADGVGEVGAGVVVAATISEAAVASGVGDGVAEEPHPASARSSGVSVTYANIASLSLLQRRRDMLFT